MNIFFEKIHLNGFMSFNDAEISLSEPGYINVLGINNNPLDNALSNGSGKSSIWEAIIWALTGDTIRGTKDVCNNILNTGTYVELWFRLDNNSYYIRRSKKHVEYKTNLIFFVNGEDKSGKGIRDTEKIVSEYLPEITTSLLGSVIIMGQGLPHRFSNNTPAGRKEILEQLSKSDFMISDLKDRITIRKNDLNKELREIEDKLLEDKTKLPMIEKDKNKLLEELEQIKNIDYSEDIEKLSKQIEEYEKKISYIETIKEEKNNFLKKINDDIAILIESKSNELNSLKDKYSVIDEKKQSVMDLRAQINSINSQIRKYKSITDICPTCGQKLPNVHKIDTTELESDRSKLESDMEKINKEISDIQNRWNKEISEIDDKHKQEENVITIKKSETSSTISKLEVELKATTRELNDCSSQLSILEYKEKNKSDILNEHIKRISELDKLMADINQNIVYNSDKQIVLQQHIEVITKFDTAVKRDFRGYLLLSVIDFIDRNAKHYSKVIFGHEDVGVTLDGNNLLLTYQGKEIESLSGGERQKVDLIIQFSIRDYLCRYTNFSANILVLDEIFDNLDAIGCDKVIEVITNELKDVSSVYIVTHRGDLSIPRDAVITVVKESDGISYIRG